MTNVLRRLRMADAFRTAALCATLCLATFAAPALHAQDASSTPETPLDRVLARVDFAISGAGQFSTTSNGSNYLKQNVTLTPSNTLGALITLRYIKSPYVGAELNYGYARYTDNYNVVGTASTPINSSSFVLGIQTNADEYTLGYVAHTRAPHFGVQPFASGGIGALEFKPTNGGGQNLPKEAVHAFYYSVGAENLLFESHFGLRAGIREVFYLKPDYYQNYLQDNKHATTFEPFLGIFVRF